jgi:hypothetical protein
VREILFKNLNNEVDFLEHFLSKFEQNTKCDSKTSFLGSQIQDNARLSAPSPILVPTKNDCGLKRYHFHILAPAYCRVV